jgi:hypothetical protein
MASWYEWLPPANGGASRALGLKILQVQGKGAEPTPEVGWADRPGPTGLGRPAQAHLGRVQSPLRSRGS